MAVRRVYGGGDDGGSISGASNHTVFLQNRKGSFASEPLNALFVSGSSSSTSPSMLGTSFFLISSVLSVLGWFFVEIMVLVTLWFYVLIVSEFSMLVAFELDHWSRILKLNLVAFWWVCYLTLFVFCLLDESDVLAVQFWKWMYEIDWFHLTYIIYHLGSKTFLMVSRKYMLGLSLSCYKLYWAKCRAMCQWGGWASKG